MNSPNNDGGGVYKRITDLAALEACLGKPPGAMQLKVVDHIDAGAKDWLSASPLMFASFGSKDGVTITLGGGAPGFVEVLDPLRLRVADAFLDAPNVAQKDRGFGALFLVPGLGETLRVNGRVISVDEGAIEVDVAECYVHCAKSLIRSDFWKPSLQPDAPLDAMEFLRSCSFLALATIDDKGRADVSPKGDPAGMLIRPSQDAAWFADRPGNRRADSFRNILTQPHVAIAALIPGMNLVALIRGKACLSTDDEIRSRFTVRDKTPLLATCLENPDIWVRSSAALERAPLWSTTQRHSINAADVLANHVKLSKENGFKATLARVLISVPGLMQRGLDHDYKTKLY
jgi:uncharacterized protein